MNSFLLLTIISSLIVLANSHAVLDNPKPFNPNPSKTSPCGGGTTSTLAEAAWQVGTVVQITWQVVATDGEGTVALAFDVNGAQTFNAANAIQLGNAPLVGFYNFTFTVPQLTCAGPNGLCTAQFASSSAWFSCTSVQLTAVPPPPINTNPTCQLVNGLTYCTQLNGQYALIPYGQTAVATDQNLVPVLAATLYNPNVFTTPNATGCNAAYQNFLCHNAMPYCGGIAAACQTVCNNALQLCGISASHIGLYNCAAGPASCCQNNTLPCAATGGVTSPSTAYTIPNVYSGPKPASASSVLVSMMYLLFALWLL